MSAFGRAARTGTIAACLLAIGAVTPSTTGATSALKTPDACAIVTNADLEEAVGVPFEAGEDRGGQGGPATSTCSFHSDDIDITVVATTAAKGKAKQAFSVRVLELGSPKKSQKVSGLGARANFTYAGGSLPRATLVVVDGKKGVAIYSDGPDLTKAGALDQSTAVAEVALANL